MHHLNLFSSSNNCSTPNDASNNRSNHNGTRRNSYTQTAHSRVRRRSLMPWLVFLFSTLLCSQSAYAEWGLNMPRGVTPVSENVYDLHMIIFYICCAIAVVVFGIMFWSIFHHRKSKGHKAAHFHESTLVEIIWTLIPLVILILMAIPATKAVFAMYNYDDAELDIQITGYQWKWRYNYIGEDIDYFSVLSTPKSQITNESDKGENYLLEVDRPLVLPVGKKVRFLLTSNDVIHSWWVPELAVKKDTIPGFINEAWTLIKEPGIYRGQCAELCGQDHGFMPVVVKAVPEDEYNAWLAEQKELKAIEIAKAAEAAAKVWDMDKLMTLGKTVYDQSCAACHQANGEGIPPVFPGLKDSPITKGDIAEHVRIVLHGRTGTAMAAYAPQLTDADVAAVVTYERNAWTDNPPADNLIQPSDIAQYR